MRRSFVGGRGLVAGVGGLGQLRFGPDKPVGQLRDLAGELENDAVLLLDVALQESEAFLEGALAFVHADTMRGGGRQGKTRQGYDVSDTWRIGAIIGG